MEIAHCQDCGGRLSLEQWSEGLCLSCLLDLGLGGGSAHGAGEPLNAPTLSHPAVLELSPGQVLGDRYRIRSLLGRGGMGEVFRAYDLKLRLDVALKAVRPGLVADARARDSLRHEVRTAREVVSPNVCRVFDLVDFEERELVSMEFVDGVTLAEMLKERSPLTLQEAREIASQFLAGLEAIHAADLVHRDIKPENVMLTRAGRVVVMDFGIARALAPAPGGTVAGTPAYMAPEHARGEAVDARADVFSAGVVLAEMVASGGTRSAAAREAVWRSVRAEPPRLDDSPWAPVLRRAVAPNRDHRYSTAAALSRALDEVTLRTTGDESQRPYPGLASFTERDAAYFVGRELEIEDMWKKLRRPHLLAIIGPSGAGKSSFLRAGLAPSAPAGWRVVITTPSHRPFASLAHALAPELAGDADAVARLIDVEQPGVAVDVVSRWRGRHDQVLLVLDQFEELFTQSPAPVQERFAELMADLALEADVHVLLSMRDDFLIHCQRFDSLSPIFSGLTALGPPTGAALRRALVQPALKCGYRFEDEGIVEEMLAQVSGERGALPLVAFAMSRLWEHRDREHGLLTRAAYQEIGGVGGALAQHAEATLEHIGQDRIPIVREVLRNLVTAQGTRATLDRDELLSVFGDPSKPVAGDGVVSVLEAAEVLDALVDARLLTAYEPPSIEPDTAGRRRIEIVHESLLTSWPRLVRWQTQDQDGAQLRDQLRQAARLWEERGKPEDLLWTGTSFREYELWRERYAGSLSSSEDGFARAMTARAVRRRLQRRLAVASLTAAALVVALTMGVLWRRSENARAQAVAAAEHAESQQLFTMAQAGIAQNPTAAVAYALASLERADSPHARRLALRALWQGPTSFILTPTDDSWEGQSLAFSIDGEWLSAVSQRTGLVRLWRSDGSAVREIPATGSQGTFAWGSFGPDSRTFVVTTADSIRVHEILTGREIARIAGNFRWGFARGGWVVTGAFLDPTSDGRAQRLIKAYPLPTLTPERTVGTWTSPPGQNGAFAVDPSGESLWGLHGGSLFEIGLRDLDAAPRLVIRGDDPIGNFLLSPDGGWTYTGHRSGQWHGWPRTGGAPAWKRQVRIPGEPTFETTVSADGRWLVDSGSQVLRVWDLLGPAAAEPIALRPSGRSMAIDPTNTWMAVHGDQSVSVRPLAMRHPHVLRGPTNVLRHVAFDTQGTWIAAGGETAGIKVWSLGTDARVAEARLIATGLQPTLLKTSPRGDFLAAGTTSGVWLVPLDGRPPERLPGFDSMVIAIAVDAPGRRVAAGGGLLGDLSAKGEALIRVWDLDTRDVTVLDAGDGQLISSVEFVPDGRLLSTGSAGVRLWDLQDRKAATLMTTAAGRAKPSRDGRHLLILRAHMRPGGAVGTAVVYDMQDQRSWDLSSHGAEVTSVAWDTTGSRVITGSRDGMVRVGPMTGEEPHLLMGHDDAVWNLDVERGGRWIASCSSDGTVRLWPMPEGPPLHALPREELLERLRSLTNYRVVADPDSPNGYRLDFEPFQGWNRTPPRW